MSTLPKNHITPEQYLEIDRQAERKSEYYDGEMFAMAGAGLRHNEIVANIIGTLHAQLRGKPCRALPSDMRVRISSSRYVYPDVTVVCGKPELADNRGDILLNPTVVIEVLSPSTASFDRGLKFDAYTALESLRDYVLISTETPSIEVFSRQSDGRWLLTKAVTLDASLELDSIACRRSLADIYANVDFPRRESEASA